MRGRILGTAGAAVLLVLLGAGCGGGIDLRGEDGAGVSIGEDGNVSVGDGDNEVEIPTDGGGAVVGDDLSLNIASNGETVNEDCAERDVSIVATGATVTLDGPCGSVSVAGNDNQVHLGSTPAVSVLGSDNLVYYASGSPEVSDLGGGNSVQSGGNATP